MSHRPYPFLVKRNIPTGWKSPESSRLPQALRLSLPFSTESCPEPCLFPASGPDELEEVSWFQGFWELRSKLVISLRRVYGNLFYRISGGGSQIPASIAMLTM